MEIIKDIHDTYTYVSKNLNEQIIYGSLNGKFKIGDSVKVIRTGQLYSSYKYMANAMKIPHEKWGNYDLKEGYVGVVIARKIHQDNKDILYGNQFNCIHIIGEEGLELIEKKSYIKSFNFEDDFKIC